jgi:chemotaxis protein CheZ
MASITQDDEDLEALFDRIVEERAAAVPPATTAAPDPPPAHEGVAASTDAEPVFQRVGHLTRALHDALRELGYDRKIEQAAHALPDAHDRLDYIAKLTGDAAERVLGEVERGQALCAQVRASAQGLDARWDALMQGRLGVDEFKALAGETHAFLAGVAGQAGELDGRFGAIMMAQDFHDLSGQVVKRVAGIVRRLENDLLALLLETCPSAARPDDGALGGPAIPGRAGVDVVTDQAQVDQLLESLGF